MPCPLRTFTVWVYPKNVTFKRGRHFFLEERKICRGDKGGGGLKLMP